MGKSRPFSIYLLKPGYDAANALKGNHKLESKIDAKALPEGATLFVLDGPQVDLWWTAFFDIQATIKQTHKGAIVFLPIADRCFALSFGHVYQNLKDESFEHDFGLRVTLNCVDSKKLKSTDTLQPGVARRQRIQSPAGEELTYFDFDRNSSVLRSLTGKVSDQYKELFKDASGASALNIKSNRVSSELPELCASLLELYQSDDYRKTFPDIQNIVPVREPEMISQLSDALVEAVRTKAENLYLTIPDIVDYRKDAHYASFSGTGRSLVYEDVYLGKYYDYLQRNGYAVEQIQYDDLKRHSLNLVDENEKSKESFSIVNCLIFEATLGDGGQTYHLAEGKWYKVENSYLERLKEALDPLCADIALPHYSHDDEGDYNRTTAESVDGFICLDQENISPSGETQIEPCDLYAVRNGFATFHHIKRSTFSGQLSHLFNQGTNAIELLKVEPKSVEKLQSIIRAKTVPPITDDMLRPISDQRYEVVFGIVTHKDRSAKSLNLPLFSRISLMRSTRWLKVSGTPCKFGFIQDQSGEKAGVPKKGRKKAASVKESQEATAEVEVL
jgi:uncharacterized protein (TIGR04141 family)